MGKGQLNTTLAIFKFCLRKGERKFTVWGTGSVKDRDSTTGCTLPAHPSTASRKVRLPQFLFQQHTGLVYQEKFKTYWKAIHFGRDSVNTGPKLGYGTKWELWHWKFRTAMLNILRALKDKGRRHSEQMDRVSRERHSQNIHTKSWRLKLFLTKMKYIF